MQNEKRYITLVAIAKMQINRVRISRANNESDGLKCIVQIISAHDLIRAFDGEKLKIHKQSTLRRCKQTKDAPENHSAMATTSFQITQMRERVGFHRCDVESAQTRILTSR